jgi:hypothetical protein
MFFLRQIVKQQNKHNLLNICKVLANINTRYFNTPILGNGLKRQIPKKKLSNPQGSVEDQEFAVGCSCVNSSV